MPETLVSCVVPVHNGERFLRAAVESILAQTFTRLEVIVVDDGSTDRSAAVARSFGGSVALVQEPHRGPAAARNAGVRAARGTFVTFLDADDEWERDKLSAQVERMRNEPDLDLCFTRFQNFWMDELQEEALRYRDHPLAKPSAAWSICTLLAHRNVLERYGPFDESLRTGENMTWFLRAAGQGARIGVLPGVLMRRRLHRDNATRAAESLNFEQFFPILKAWRDHARKDCRPDGTS